MRTTMIGCLFASLAALLSGGASAQACGGIHEVRAGDSLSGLAARYYADAGLWRAILDENAEAIGRDPGDITVGMRLRLPCIDGRPRDLVAAGAGADVAIGVGDASGGPIPPPGRDARASARIDVLTASGLAPFADASLPGGGMLTEVVRAALDAADPDGGASIHWVDDRDAHLEPLLSEALLDLGFPWSRPDCTADPDMSRCAELVFSEPLFEALVLLFVDLSDPLRLDETGPPDGARLCRPAGRGAHVFDEGGRNWLKAGRITLVRAGTAAECLRLLAEGAVDGAVLNEFVGRAAIGDLGLSGRIGAAEGPPVALEGLHVVAHTAHPGGRAMLATFAEGLARIRADGTYRRIIEAHMTRVLAEF